MFPAQFDPLMAQSTNRPTSSANCSDYKRRDPRDVLSWRTDKIILVLDRIRDVGNISSIFRTCDALGVQVIWSILPPHYTGAFSSSTKKIRSKMRSISRGADRYLSQRFFQDEHELLKAIREEGRQIWSTDLGAGAVSLRSGEQVELPQEGIALVMGEETAGVSQAILDASSKRVFIPTFGFVQSLNVAVATALVLQALLWQVKVEHRGIGSAALRESVERDWKEWLEETEGAEQRQEEAICEEAAEEGG
ncbi:hypothetical protein GUITHDRAFT_111265 [Guillardia theta CCMP2712]|uniref:tRNA/rRNA methyltransferase SpoU type domain-containing protein n=1 Tax=Guillardia theta (strain CCMP2712) TaxID=905079 RepID=L1J2Z9_GUITC|nr:hypothetical protein GUITHDRAFT_111265 [Guillardia theta CCMP2712]EKX42898.1 hypothetical protein GUITHDRAFT_111265 [Guillardia theta CCMP2712]|eukprot:XP_005829878.1 hypothetical protein GUITHDRAFT_111265 [Guillardia theta CCMP2712]